MKRTIQLAVACVVVAAAGQAQAELITNGTFDSDLAGWTIGGAISTTWDSGTAHIGRPGTPGVSIFEQAFDIPFGSDTLAISFDYEWQVTAPSVVDDFMAELIYTSTSGTVTETLLSENSSAGVFGSPTEFGTRISLIDLDNSLGNGTIRFTLTENNSSRGTRIELDNVHVIPVPEPSTFALLGIGGIALVGYGARRKRQQAA